MSVNGHLTRLSNIMKLMDSKDNVDQRLYLSTNFQLIDVSLMIGRLLNVRIGNLDFRSLECV